MRIASRSGARRLVRRLSRNTAYPAIELVLLTLLAIQCARLVWAILTPLGPVGDWRAPLTLRPMLTASPALLAEFDPFFRLSGDSGPVVVTSLDLSLHGIREDRASGRGSAILGSPDGQQRSYAVGDEIIPGVTLSGVSFDSVTISRNGTAERIFIDQSSPAPAPAPAPGPQQARP